MRGASIYVVILGFLIGIFTVSVIPWDSWLIVGWTSASAGIALALFTFPKRNFNNYLRNIFILSITIACFGIGALRMHAASLHQGDALLDVSVGETVEIMGMVSRDRDMRESNQKLTVDVTSATLPDGERYLVESKILVSVERAPAYKYGDTIVVEGKLQLPENFESETGREFDYVNYLGKDGIFYQMFYPEIALVTENGGSFIRRTMLDLKHIMINSITRTLPQPEGGLISGELFGEKAALGGKLSEDFRTTGVIHVVVLSGFNVTIVAMFFIWLLSRFFHPRIALGLGIISIVLFAMLVGGGATVVRASVMAILVIIARLVGREYDVLRGLFTAAAIMALINPHIVAFDISFQLSFLATLSLITIAPFVEKKLSWVTNAFTIRETLIATLAAQVFVLPLLLYSIGELSVVSVVVNLLVVPLVPMAMLFGFVTALVGLVSAAVAIVPAFPTYILLKLQLIIVEFFAKLSFASVAVPPIPGWAVILLYAGIFIWVIRYASRMEKEELAKYSATGTMNKNIDNSKN